MPIRPEKQPAYEQPAWVEGRVAALERAGNRCEHCGLANGAQVQSIVAPDLDPDNPARRIWRTHHDGIRQAFAAEGPVDPDTVTLTATAKPVTVVLTVAHYDHDEENHNPENLRVWCQLAHLFHDRHQHAANAAETRAARKDMAKRKRKAEATEAPDDEQQEGPSDPTEASPDEDAATATTESTDEEAGDPTAEVGPIEMSDGRPGFQYKYGTGHWPGIELDGDRRARPGEPTTFQRRDANGAPWRPWKMRHELLSVDLAVDEKAKAGHEFAVAFDEHEAVQEEAKAVIKAVKEEWADRIARAETRMKELAREARTGRGERLVEVHDYLVLRPGYQMVETIRTDDGSALNVVPITDDQRREYLGELHDLGSSDDKAEAESRLSLNPPDPIDERLQEAPEDDDGAPAEIDDINE